jgi:hypothetical protein
MSIATTPISPITAIIAIRANVVVENSIDLIRL